MGWSRTEPELPAGSDWEQVGTTKWENNHIRIESTVYVARLDGNGFAVRVAEKRTQIGTYWQTDSYLACTVDGKSETYTDSWWASSGVTASAYYTDTAAAGAEIVVTVGYSTDVSASLKKVSFAAPPLLGSTVWVNVSGEWKKAEAVYVKVDGEWKTGLTKIRIGDDWK